MISIRLFAAPFAALLACGVAFAGTQPEFDYSGTESSVYQWSVTSSPPDVERRDGRAFLWIPERCRRLAGVVVGQQNMLEEPVFECPAFRRELAKANLGIVFISPIQCGVWHFDAKKGEWLADILSRLAEESGYAELARCPVAFIGHSAMAMWPYFAASLWHDRAFAGVSLKGAWADRSKDWGSEAVGRGLAGIPFLLLDGEYEDAENRARRTRDFCNAYSDIPFSFCGEMGAGHFDWSDELARYLGIYFRKAIAFKGAASAKDAMSRGWLMERWKRREAPSEKPAPVADYKGDPADAYWYFDREMALETAKLQERFRKCDRTPLVGYRVGDRALEQHDDHLQIHVPYDGAKTVSFRPAFDDEVVKSTGDRLSDWTGLPLGAKAPHPTDEAGLYVQKICGPCAKIGPDEYELRFSRGWPMPVKGTTVRGARDWCDVCFQAIFPGGDGYRRAVQQAMMRIHAPGAPTGAGGWYVREGAATVDPHTGAVKMLPLPPRAKKPHTVTVVEWTFGQGETARAVPWRSPSNAR